MTPDIMNVALPGADPIAAAQIMRDQFGSEASEIALAQAAHFMAQQEVEPWRYWRAIRQALATF